MRNGLVFLILWLFALPAPASWFEDQAAIMGTRIHVALWADDAEQAQQAIGVVFDEMRRIDALMSPFRKDSELHRVNARAAEAPVTVSAELFDLVRVALEISRLSEGAFDITFASAGFHYDFRNHRRPDEATLDSLKGVSWHMVSLDPQAHSIRFADPRVRIDLGGIAKGYAVQRAAGLLRQLGIRHAEITAGGDTRLLGDRHGRPWMVGIRDPRKEGRALVEIPLADEAISTSGDYERYFVENGVRYHHILVPSTGMPAHGVRSASVIGPDATRTDALSTTLFVLGIRRGMALVDRLPGYEAVMIDSAGRLYASRGLSGAP